MFNFISRLIVESSDMILISSVYGLSPPSAKDINYRKKKVEKLKELMGEKYLLATPVQRIKDATGN